MAPPSSSGTTVGEALNILNGWNLRAEPRATALFHYLEASRLAYADRDAYVGDPRYVGVPVQVAAQPGVRRDPAVPGARHGAGLPGGARRPDPALPEVPQTSDDPGRPPSNEGQHTNNIVTVGQVG